ncbi:hypothetical protein ABPG77_004423 [Micractinium sp. CCAP 211/92]
MRLLRAVQEDHCHLQQRAPPYRRWHRRSLASWGLAHAAAAILGAALLAGTLPATRANRAGGHDCPQYGGSILDMPDTTDCRRLLSKLSGTGCLPHRHAAVIQEEPEEACCRNAASFFDLQCHCWGSQFDHSAVAAVAAVDAACLHHAEQLANGQKQQQSQQQQSEAAAAAGGIELTRLRERQGQQAQHAQQQQQQQQQQRPADIRLFVGVLSAAERRDRRDAIRATWGTHPGAYRLLFFLARPNATMFDAVWAEAVEHRDMVVLGHIAEHYHNITHQTLEMLRFAAADPSVTHVLKTDDDSYVHFDRLLHRLAATYRERLFLGHIENPGGRPHRDPGHPWFVSREEWPEERFPPWAHGAGYVLSADLAAELAPGTAFAASEGGHLFKLEDIALAGWLEWAAARRGFRVHLVKDRRFNYEGCRFGDLVSHYMKPEQLRCMWERQGRCGC